MKTWPLPALAFATAPLFATYALMPEAPPPQVGKDPFALPDTRPARPAQAARPSEESIRQAVREVLADHPGQARPAQGTALSGDPYKEFARQFSEAERPHCLGPNALKHQPASTVYKGWNIGASGIFALPFWATAIVRGKCNWQR